MSRPTTALLLLALVRGSEAHGWITSPVSRLEMARNHFVSGMPNNNLRWTPQSCNGPNACGGLKGAEYTESWEHWDPLYARAHVPVPRYGPGDIIDVHITITADHGGQSWLMISCDGSPTENGNWTYMERAPGDRQHHFMPSNPTIYAWAKDEAKETMGDVIKASWVVPETFDCPRGRGVGRWLWKTGNTCNDVHNIARKTETFVGSEYCSIAQGYGSRCQGTCKVAPETFITCFDIATGPPPTPSPPSPTPPSPPPTPPAPAPPYVPSTPACCWSAWGDKDTCGSYPRGGAAGLCNTAWSKKCSSAGDCPKSTWAIVA